MFKICVADDTLTVIQPGMYFYPTRMGYGFRLRTSRHLYSLRYAKSYVTNKWRVCWDHKDELIVLRNIIKRIESKNGPDWWAKTSLTF